MAFGVTRDPLSGAMRSNTAATGDRLYGLGRSRSANLGKTLDKTGYEEREARKRARRREADRRRAQAAGSPGRLGINAATPFAGR